MMSSAKEEFVDFGGNPCKVMQKGDEVTVAVYPKNKNSPALVTLHFDLKQRLKWINAFSVVQ